MDHLNRNNVYNKSFELYQSDGRTPLDCSELTVKYIVKKNKSDSDANAVLHQEFVNAETNLFLAQFDATQTALLQEGEYIQALKIYRTGNLNEEIWQDRLKVEKGVFNG